MTGPVYVVGAGGHAKVVVSALLSQKIAVDGILDDNPGKTGTDVLGVRVIGPTSMLSGCASTRAVIAVGTNETRKELAERYDQVEWIRVVHSHAYVDASARLGEGTVVLAGAIVQPDSVLGRHCIVNTAATVDHDCLIGDYVHIAPGTHLGGQVQIGHGCLIGLGSSVLPSRHVGEWTTVGAGAVVVCDLPDHTVAVGIPAKPSRRIQPGERAHQ